jgi:hypothetical protein
MLCHIVVACVNCPFLEGTGPPSPTEMHVHIAESENSRDLAQRHHSAYHETKDSMQSSPCDVPAIACIHCASAKTRCDKRVPCSRCAEKDLPCEARFARRRRSARPFRAASSAKGLSSPQSDGRLVSIVPQDPNAEGGTSQSNTPMAPQPQHPDMSRRKTYPLPTLASAAHNYETPSPSVREMDTVMSFDNDLLEGDYQDLMMWNQYSLFPDNDAGMQNGTGIPPSMELAGNSLSPDALSLGYGTMPTPSLSSSHTRTASMASALDFEQQFNIIDGAVASIQETIIPELDAAIATEAAWPLARCNPLVPSAACPRTAIMHLEALEEHSKHETWNRLAHNIATSEATNKGEISVLPLNASTRDRMLAITQSFLHRALETHRGGMKGWARAAEGGFNFLVLPPSSVLEYFLRNSLRNVGLYYLLVQGGTLDPNHLMPNSQTSTLLLLLMIAHGAISEARILTAGLTEACRISLFHVIEKDVELSADPMILRCALLFITLGAWSGDAWHMNIAMGQRAMYLAVSFHQKIESSVCRTSTDELQMLKHAGMMETSLSMSIPSDSSSTELRWRAWQQQESRSR